MAELDENSLRNNSNHSARPQKVNIRQNSNFTPVISAILPYHSLKRLLWLQKSTETAVAATPKKDTGRGKEPTEVPSSYSRKEKPEIAEEAAVAVARARRRSAAIARHKRPGRDVRERQSVTPDHGQARQRTSW